MLGSERGLFAAFLPLFRGGMVDGRIGGFGGAGEYGMGGLGRSGCERSCGGELAGRCRRAMNIRRWLLGGGDA